MIVATLAATAWAPQATVGRRAVLAGAAAISTVPLPAVALSKEKAKEKALQKETASEAKQAMKEYKFAPRPELQGDAKTGYTYKEGTVGAGSQGELAGYFKDKGAKIQADFQADKARATGMSASEAKKLADDLEAKTLNDKKQAYLEKRNRKSFDEIEIEKFCKTEAGKTAVDNVGRKQCP